MTSLPNDAAGNPEPINHVFVSSSNHQTLYVSIGYSTAGHNGWYKSTDGGSHWTQINAGLPSTRQIRRAAIGPSDVIYAILEDDTSPECGPGGGWTRLYKTTNGGASWTKLSPTGTCGGIPCPVQDGPVCDCCFSVAVNPQNASDVIWGTLKLFRSTDGGATATLLGNGVIHADIRSLVFDPTNPQVFYVGTDGGPWKGDSLNPTLWTYLHGNLATLEFYHGSIDNLNYGNSGGGTQDNGDEKGGSGIIWTSQVFGDGKWVLFDSGDSNTMYYTGTGDWSDIKKSVDGGGRIRRKNDGLPLNARNEVDVYSDALALDPQDNSILLTFSDVDRRVYRSLSAGESDYGIAWTAISQQFGDTGETRSLAAAPVFGNRSDLIFVGTLKGVWRTTPGTLGNFQHVGTGIPDNIYVTGFAFEDGQNCTATSCRMYVTTGSSGLGAIYFSDDAGNTWYNIGTGLPNVPMSGVAIHPSDPNTVFVATDVGLFQGTHTGGTPGAWSWCAYNNGLPKTAVVKSVAVHKDSGTLRAFTYGRSVWETSLGTAAPDLKVNTVANPVTDVQPPLIGSNAFSGATRFGVAWRDDRNGANNWRAYFKAFSNPATGPFTPLNANEVRVDASAPLVESLAFSGHPSLNTTIYCGRFAWHDRRVNGVNSHIFTQYTCSDGWQEWTEDVRVETHANGTNAANPTITMQKGGVGDLEFAVSWESGSSPQRIYGGFFDWFGSPKFVPAYGTASFPVSTSALDASAPAMAANSAGEVVVAWREHAAANSDYVMARRYTRDGVPITAPVRIDNGTPANRYQVNVAFDSLDKAIIAWSESPNGQMPYIVAVSCPSSSLGTCMLLDGGCQRCVGGEEAGNGCRSGSDCPHGSCGSLGTVSCGARVPLVGGETGQFPSMAGDASGNSVIVWQGNPTDGGANPVMNAMAKSFTVWASLGKNEFRVDHAGCTDVRSPVATRSRQTGEFVYAWRDRRSGHFDVYARKIGGAVP
jgi:hypothetical protein